MVRVLATAVLVWAVWSGVVRAQQATTIQLPTFNFTTASTTVSVPDGGTALLGGINRAAEGQVSRGVPMLSKIPGLNRLFRNEAIGRDVSASNITVVPRIIILEEEELLQTGVTSDTSTETLTAMASQRGRTELAAARRPVSPAEAALASRAAFLAGNVARHAVAVPAPAAEQAAPSVAEVRRRTELALAERAAEATLYFAKGQQAETEGKRGVAKIYYQMAARRAAGDLQSQITARLAALEGAKPATQLAGR